MSSPPLPVFLMLVPAQTTFSFNFHGRLAPQGSINFGCLFWALLALHEAACLGHARHTMGFLQTLATFTFSEPLSPTTLWFVA